jgi:hypothetical protein
MMSFVSLGCGGPPLLDVPAVILGISNLFVWYNMLVQSFCLLKSAM